MINGYKLTMEETKNNKFVKGKQVWNKIMYLEM